METNELWEVYPTENIFGYTHTYCKSEESAKRTKYDMMDATGKLWKIRKVE